MALQRLDQGAEIAVAGKDHRMVQPGGKLHGVDGQFDVHVALDLTPAHGVGVFLGGLCHHAVTVVMQPVDQRTDRGIILSLHQGGIVISAHQLAPTVELLPQQLVIDVKSQGLGRGIEIGSVDEDRQAIVLVKHSCCLQ